MGHIVRILFALGVRFFAPVAGLAVVAFWYLWYAGGGATGPIRMADFCDAVGARATVEQARALAKGEGFSIPVDTPEKLTAMTSVMMYQRTFCEMTVADGKVTSARLFTMD